MAKIRDTLVAQQGVGQVHLSKSVNRFDLFEPVCGQVASFDLFTVKNLNRVGYDMPTRVTCYDCLMGS